LHVKIWVKFSILCQDLGQYFHFISLFESIFEFHVKFWVKISILCQDLGQYFYFMSRFGSIFSFHAKIWVSIFILCYNLGQYFYFMARFGSVFSFHVKIWVNISNTRSLVHFGTLMSFCGRCHGLLPHRSGQIQGSGMSRDTHVILREMVTLYYRNVLVKYKTLVWVGTLLSVTVKTLQAPGNSRNMGCWLHWHAQMKNRDFSRSFSPTN
jgi:hypothetical protein